TESIKWMQELPHHLTFKYAELQARVVHGTVEKVAGYVFESTPWTEKQRQLQQAGADLILGGHCGLPFNSSNQMQYWLNAGVIGMPANDGTPRVWYMTLADERGLHYQHHAFNYDHQTAAQLMRDHKLPTTYAKTLETGIWDNCEILPEVETMAQGQQLVF
ncbi:MAG: metallophosphoesterase, partial [Bacteroidota bacterium]